MGTPDYAQIAKEARLKVLELIYLAQTSHIGSNFSCIDILTVLFEHIDLDRDVFILSKGWAAASLYYFLWRKGRITEDELNSFCHPGSKYIGLAEPIHPDILIAGGSMQMGLPAAVGIAIAKKLKKDKGRIFCCMSDGEMAGGMIYESALIAAHQKLDNLTVILDNNGLQALGKTDTILKISPIQNKWETFGWHCLNISGHNYSQIEKSIKFKKNKKKRLPLAIIAKTDKGHGVSFMSGNNDFHYKPPTDNQYNLSLSELS